MHTVLNLEEYNYHLDDLITNPPYSHTDMVIMLAEGLFVIEGKPSTYNQATFYAEEVNTVECWKAIKVLNF